MLDLFNTAKPQGCDIQTFYGSAAVSNSQNTKSWNKPRGVSHVYMLLIGAGSGTNDSVNGGGSGSVTVWYGAAQHVPDQLEIHVGQGNGQASQIKYRGPAGGPYTLLIGDAASGVSRGTAASANNFTASGFYQSVDGQNGSGSSGAASTTTFLPGGECDSNYGYTFPYGSNGSFQLQPIIVGMSASSGSPRKGGIGCGGSYGGTLASGGPGMVLIASW